MKGTNLYLLLFFVSLFIQKSFSQNIQVVDSYSSQDLVQNVLINSPCANVSNFSVAGGNFGTSENSYGYFTAANNSFPFANGIVLSTGKANSATGPNTSTLSETAPNWNGDNDLQQALSIGNTVDATSLEFDFVPQTSSISFDYIFASEEYHGTAPCQYSDGFAFLLKKNDATSTYENLAIIPNTTTPVKVTTVHPDIQGGCGPENETFFGSYNGINAPINFNGQTTVMTARANVVPGKSYHIKLVIADESNYKYDSAIFLGGNSFNIGLNLGPDRLIATNNALCPGTNFAIDATQSGTNSYQWFKDGILQSVTTPIFTAQSAGVYKVIVTPQNAVCAQTGSIKLEYYPIGVLQNTTLVQCDIDNDGKADFNLQQALPLILAQNPNLIQPQFYTSLSNAQNEVGAISNPTTFSNHTSATVYVRFKDSATSCSTIGTLNLQTSNNMVAPQSLIAVCDSDLNLDGFSSFDLATIATPSLLMGLPSGLQVAYFGSQAEALSVTNPLSNPFDNTVAFNQTIFGRIINGADCYSIVPITLKVNVFLPAVLSPKSVFICNHTPAPLIAPAGYSGYLWNTGNSTKTINVSAAGVFEVEITDGKGCKNKQTFTVTDSEKATITNVLIFDFNEENSFEVQFTGNGSYVFSIDGVHFQNSPLFQNVAIGEYSVNIKDQKNCGTTTSSPFYVLDYPRFFTPNQDGFNDFWQIKNLNKQPKSIISIYDRFGKLLHYFSGAGDGWNGTYNGNLLPADDYWFCLELLDGRKIKGHFALKR